MRTVAVSGISGVLGGRVLAQLEQDPTVEAVIGLDRTAPSGWSSKLRFRPTELGSDDLTPRLDGATAVVHLAWSAADGSVEATRRLLAAAEDAGVDQVLHVSCASVYGAWPDNAIPLPEDTALRPNPEFSLAVEKAEAERLVTDWAARHPRVAVAVVRPAVMLGDGAPGPAARTLYPALTIRGRPAGPPVQFVDAGDVARAIVALVRNGTRGVFNVAPDGWLTDEDVRGLVGPPARLPLNRRVAERAVRIVHWLRGGRRPGEVAAFGRHPVVIANDRLRATGWAPRHSSEEALVASSLPGRWPQLSPQRRQELALGVATATVAGAVAGGVALARRARRR